MTAEQQAKLVPGVHPGRFPDRAPATAGRGSKNVAIEYRWANNENNQLPELAADLVRRRVAVIVSPVSTAAALAAKAATTTIPVVFSAGADPVRAGLVASLNRPGGNLTGVHFLAAALGAKRLGLLHELRPEAARFALLVNPSNPVTAETMIKDVTAAAVTIGRQVEVVTAGSYRDIDTAFAALVQKRADALLVMPDPMFLTRRVQLATLATRHVLPAIYPLREFAEAPGHQWLGPFSVPRAPMTSANSLLPILRRLDEIERKLDRILEELRPPRPLAIRCAGAQAPLKGTPSWLSPSWLALAVSSRVLSTG
jgi:ABC transporter substrate binding protein